MSNDSIPTPSTNNPPIIPDSFEDVILLASNKVAHSSSRIYQRTYEAWHQWCKDHHHDPFNVSADPVLKFLSAQRVAFATRQRHLTALRQLAKFLAIDPEKNRIREAAYKSLRFIRAPESGATEPLPRSKRPLKPGEANLALRVWADDDLTSLRNRALIAVLLLSGARRSEVSVLRWADIDLKNGLLRIEHGKDNKRRTAALIGHFALDALEAWKEAQGPNRQYVFCRIRKGEILDADRPLAPQSIYNVVKETAERVLGKDQHFTPHDSRRTLIYEALINGATIEDVKEQVGHRTTRMTEYYAKRANAQRRRERLKLRYGDDDSSTSS